MRIIKVDNYQVQEASGFVKMKQKEFEKLLTANSSILDDGNNYYLRAQNEIIWCPKEYKINKKLIDSRSKKGEKR